ncbi:hypothetical protein QQF64_008398 [Cirrhinus molitorella]|uniref:Uncharacterized protein n=1 Tax=Cirrhinus molitorella TaxID=172907 RepID=A0ABR3M611_9TELE
MTVNAAKHVCKELDHAGPVLFLNMEAPGQVNEQGQLPARGRGGRGGRGGVRVRGGGIGGRGRGARRHCAVPDEIRATVIDHENLWPHRLQCVDGQEGEDGGQ